MIGVALKPANFEIGSYSTATGFCDGSCLNIQGGCIIAIVVANGMEEGLMHMA